MTPQQLEFKKKVDLAVAELTKIANFISSKGLKIKTAMFNEQAIEYFRGIPS